MLGKFDLRPTPTPFWSFYDYLFKNTDFRFSVLGKGSVFFGTSEIAKVKKAF